MFVQSHYAVKKMCLTLKLLRMLKARSKREKIIVRNERKIKKESFSFECLLELYRSNFTTSVKMNYDIINCPKGTTLVLFGDRWSSGTTE